MSAGRFTALFLAGWTVGGAALAEAPERSIRALPRPIAPAVVGEDIAEAETELDVAVTSAVVSALAVMASPRPLPKPPEVSVSAGSSEQAIGAPRPVVPPIARFA